VGFFGRKKRGYRAAFKVERHRAAAEQLRTEDPEVYRQILSQADGSTAEEAAGRDPDAFVALFLAEAEEAGVIDPSWDRKSSPASEPVWDADKIADQVIALSGLPGWEEDHVASVVAVIEPRLAELATNAEGELLQYPEWAIRTWLKMELAIVLGVVDEVVAAVAAGPNPDLLAGGLALETHSEVESVYDRAFASRGLTELVAEVMRRVLLGGSGAEYYAEHMRDE